VALRIAYECLSTMTNRRASCAFLPTNPRPTAIALAKPSCRMCIGQRPDVREAGLELHLLNLALVLAAAVGGGAVARHLGYPAILGELIAGIVLGPAALGLLSADEALSVIAMVGVLVMMLYVGMHLDLGDLRRSSWPALLAAVGGFVVPAGAGYWLATAFGLSPRSASFVALAMGLTSLATKSRVLVDLRILDTRVAHVMMAGALITDLVALVGFSALLGSGDTGGVSGGDLAAVVVKALVFIIVSLAVGIRLFPIGAAYLTRTGRIDRGTLFLIVVIVALIYGAAAELAGLHGILGTFFAGLLLRPGLFEPRVFRDVEQLVFRLSVGFLAPIFFVTAGFHVDLGVVRTDPMLLAAVVAVATAGKIAGTALFYLPSGRGWREGLAVGAGMNGRGAVEIIAAELALERGLIDQTVFSVLVLMALATTATVPFLLTRAVDWLRRHDQLVRASTRRGAIVVGAGPVARQIALALTESGRVRLIDTNLDHCSEARALGLDAIHGNALDDSILRQAGAADAQRVICITRNASVNVLVAQRATVDHGVPHASVALTGDDASSLQDTLGESTRSITETPLDLEAWNRRIRRNSAQIGPIMWPADRVVSNGPAAGEDHVALLVRRGGEVVMLSEVETTEPGDELLGLNNERPSRPMVVSDHDARVVDMLRHVASQGPGS
jgi:Kef-type K+ transport system membrane component KefB/Trk K+ transport system NAD-binding subunit